MKKIAAVLIVVFSGVLVMDAQRAARTVTNAELAKFRDRRLAAEQEYRDNYQRLGMPSPEDLAEMRDRDMDDRIELADQLRRARLEKERLELDQRRVDIDADRLALERRAADAQMSYPDYGGYGGFYGGGYGYPGVFGGGGFGFGGGFYGRPPYSHGYPSNRLLPTFSIPTYRYTPGGVVRGNQVFTPIPIAPGIRPGGGTVVFGTGRIR